MSPPDRLPAPLGAAALAAAGPGEITGLFDDAKAPDAMRTIGEVSAALGIRQHVLRYWEDQFPMLRPVKRSGGRRYYRPADVEVVRTIDRLVNQHGYTLRGARAAIEAGGGTVAAPADATAGSAAPAAPNAPAALTGALMAAEPPGRAPDPVPALRAIRAALQAALDDD